MASSRSSSSWSAYLALALRCLPALPRCPCSKLIYKSVIMYRCCYHEQAAEGDRQVACRISRAGFCMGSGHAC